jgi:hypothetical protein
LQVSQVPWPLLAHPHTAESRPLLVHPQFVALPPPPALVLDASQGSLGHMSQPPDTASHNQDKSSLEVQVEQLNDGMRSILDRLAQMEDRLPVMPHRVSDTTGDDPEASTA